MMLIYLLTTFKVTSKVHLKILKTWSNQRYGIKFVQSVQFGRLNLSKFSPHTCILLFNLSNCYCLVFSWPEPKVQVTCSFSDHLLSLISLSFRPSVNILKFLLFLQKLLLQILYKAFFKIGILNCKTYGWAPCKKGDNCEQWK